MPCTMPVAVIVVSPRACEIPKSLSIADPSSRDQDVARLDVPVHDPHRVCRCERGPHLGPDPSGLARRERAVLTEQDRQRRGLDELHHDAGLALVLHHVEHGDGVRMVQAGGDARLAHGPIRRDLTLAIAEVRLRAQHLEGDGAVEALVPRVPDDAHPTRADQLDQPVSIGDEGRRTAHRTRSFDGCLEGTPARTNAQGPCGGGLGVGRSRRDGRGVSARGRST